MTYNEEMVKQNKRIEKYEAIIQNRIDEFCNLGNEDALREHLLHGWAPLDDWSDEELADYCARFDGDEAAV